jgi:hypothetical protein
MNESGLILQNLSEMWPILLSIVFLIAWAIRLEAKVMYLEKAHEAEVQNKNEADKLIWEKFDHMQATMTAILQSLARLEGKLEGTHNERN